LEQQSLRIMNLDLLLRYGASAWKVHNEQLERMTVLEEKQLRQIKQRIQEVNWERKKQQTEGGEGLSRLSAEWNYLVKENLQIEEVCLPLEREIETLRTLVENKKHNK
ncbi:Pre-mRNA-splicing factor SPF27, partial [Oopsacas minuta]